MEDNRIDSSKRRVLIVTSVVSFIEWFNKENIEYLRKDKSCEVHIACNFDYMDDTDEVRTLQYIKQLKEEGIVLHNIHFARSPFSKENISSYKLLKSIIKRENFDLIHCHTPTVSILTRLAARDARKKGTTVMYTCHGFHFHNASPKKNWILYYPIEKYMSRFTDYLVTINHEDYNRACSFKSKNVRYIPGVGVDLSKIKNCRIDRKKYKENLGLPVDSILVLSVGELIERKNHEVIIRAVAQIDNKNIYYAICGKGPLKDHLKSLSEQLGISARVLFLGFRKDIPELCHTADISAFPSKIEGLGLAGIEAMAAGVPLVSSNVHGILDYVKDGITGYAFAPDDVNGFSVAISTLSERPALRKSMADECMKAVESFDLPNALRSMWNIYDEILN